MKCKNRFQSSLSNANLHRYSLGVAMVFVEYKDLAVSDDPADGILTEWVPIKADFAGASGGALQVESS
jgi:hypothetical protein